MESLFLGPLKKGGGLLSDTISLISTRQWNMTQVRVRGRLWEGCVPGCVWYGPWVNGRTGYYWECSQRSLAPVSMPDNLTLDEQEAFLHSPSLRLAFIQRINIYMSKCLGVSCCFNGAQLY